MATLTRTAPGASARRCRTWPLLLTGAAALLLAAAAGAEAPLFSSNDRLDFTLDLPLTTVLRKDPDNPKLEGQLRYLNDAGETVALPVTVTTRGRSRLETCRFPPLWLRFEKKTVRGTLFAKQRRLKLVTHCRDSDQYARYVQQEHGIYRAFNALTERSFRVRMLEITYRDTDRGGRSSTHPAFFIEHVDAAAKRLGREELKVERVAPEQLDGEHANLVDLFQFLIGNTDFSQLAGPPDDTCCHNGKVLGASRSGRRAGSCCPTTSIRPVSSMPPMRHRHRSCGCARCASGASAGCAGTWVPWRRTSGASRRAVKPSRRRCCRRRCRASRAAPRRAT
jgi:hypothetical protein